MSRYTNITTDIWKDPDFRTMSYSSKLLYLYLLTADSSNIAGMYRLCEDDILRNVGQEGLDAFIEGNIEGNRLWKYDRKTETILLPNYLKYNVARSPQQFKAINSAIRTLSWSELFVDWTFYVFRYCGDKALGYIEDSIKRYVQTKAAQLETREAFVVRELLKDTTPLIS